MSVRFLSALGLTALLSAAAPALATPPQSPAEHSAAVFSGLKTDLPGLRAFLSTFPKGADLHNHLSGAVYAETNISDGLAANQCLTKATLAIRSCTLKPGEKPEDIQPLSAVETDNGLYGRVVDAQSMRNFVPGPGLNAHDQFFNTFAKFGEQRRIDVMLAEVLNRAGRQNVQYVELMTTFAVAPMKTLSQKIRWTGSFAVALKQLEAQGLQDLLPAAKAELDQALQTARQRMECDSATPQPGCAVSVRFQQQISRNSAPELVATQVAFGFLLAANDPRMAGINIVSPEDYQVALRDYDLHMQMIGTMAQLYPQVGIALHAGEMTLGLVPPEQLRSHIRKAVRVAQARRIGHGVDLMYEDDPSGLLALLKERNVAVEINLTSNDVILGVKGRDHPFPVYLSRGVPTVLSSDDEGVSRIDLTNEYLRAVRDYGLSYADIKALSRRSLEYAFLPGRSLWADLPAGQMQDDCLDPAAAGCVALLNGSEKARLQMTLEAKFKAFEDKLARQND